MHAAGVKGGCVPGVGGRMGSQMAVPHRNVFSHLKWQPPRKICGVAGLAIRLWMNRSKFPVFDRENSVFLP